MDTPTTTPTNLFTDEIAQSKLLSALILFFMTLSCGYVPVRMIVNQNFIQYAMYGGGGVLMATAFCHLIPETHDNYKLLGGGASGHTPTDPAAITITTTTTTTLPPPPISIATNTTFSAQGTSNNSTSTSTATTTTMTSNEHDTNIAYNALHLISSLNLPHVEVTLCCGFFFMYIVELLMVRFVNTHTHQHPCDNTTSLVQLCNNGTGNSAGAACNEVGHQHHHNGTSSTTNIVAAMSENTAGSHDVVIVGGAGDDSSRASSTSSGGAAAAAKATTGRGFYKFIRGLLIVSAFGAHSLFDGVAIGSQESVEKVWTVFAAISCHKLIIAAVVGLELYAATLESHLWTVIHLSLFSIMSPIGIVLVVVAQNSLHLDSNHPAMILLQSFATGTLLYIIFVEILQPKGNQALEKNRLGKSISLVAGFALMLLVLTIMDDAD